MLVPASGSNTGTVRQHAFHLPRHDHRSLPSAVQKTNLFNGIGHEPTSELDPSNNLDGSNAALRRFG
jgi:hypothetical protein